jgi:hypothetical protein
MQATDFWGEIEAIEVRTPLSILREQAAALGPRTKNLVEAKVETEIAGTSFRHAFDLVVPSLDNYTYRLFEIQHDHDLYPIYVRTTAEQLTDEGAFIDWLRVRLTSPQTRKIVGNLLAQAQS